MMMKKKIKGAVKKVNSDWFIGLLVCEEAQEKPPGL